MDGLVFNYAKSENLFKKKKFSLPRKGTYITIYPTNTAYSAFGKYSLMIIPNKIRISGKTAKK